MAKTLGYNEPRYSLNHNYTLDAKGDKLASSVVLVTGGAGAIGRAISFTLASQGATVYLGGRTAEKNEKTASEIRALGLKAHGLQIDVSNAESVKKAFEEIKKREGRLDVLVNCAGGGARDKAKILCDQEPEIIESVLKANLYGSIICCREACRLMRAQNNGKIVNISSTIGVGGMKRCVDYSAAKAGIIGFTKSLAMEMGAFGVNVNCVAPGYIHRGEFGDMTADWIKTTNYLNRIPEYEDVANAVLFLSCKDSSFITGQTIIVDGGRSLGLKGQN